MEDLEKTEVDSIICSVTKFLVVQPITVNLMLKFVNATGAWVCYFQK